MADAPVPGRGDRSRIKVLAVAGSLRRGSYNRALLRALASEAGEGVSVIAWDGLESIPHYHQDHDIEPAPPEVGAMKAAWAEADAVIFITPEYNGSVPGVLKNAIDWASRPRASSPLCGKAVGLAGTSTGQYGALWALQDLKRILGVVGARVVGEPVAVPLAREVFSADGDLVDSRVAARLSALVDLVAEDVHAGRGAQPEAEAEAAS